MMTEAYLRQMTLSLDRICLELYILNKLHATKIMENFYSTDIKDRQRTDQIDDVERICCRRIPERRS